MRPSAVPGRDTQTGRDVKPRRTPCLRSRASRCWVLGCGRSQHPCPPRRQALGDGPLAPLGSAGRRRLPAVGSAISGEGGVGGRCHHRRPRRSAGPKVAPRKLVEPGEGRPGEAGADRRVALVKSVKLWGRWAFTRGEFASRHAIFPWCDAIGFPEDAAEVAGILETPAGPDRAHRIEVQC